MVLIKGSAMELSTSESSLQPELAHQTCNKFSIEQLYAQKQTLGIKSGSPIS